MQQLLSERIRHRSPFAYVLLVFSYVTASKISLIQVQGCEKRNPTQMQQPGLKIIFENSDFHNLDRYLDRQYLSSLIKPRQIARCRGGVEKILRGQELSRSIHQLLRRCQDCNKKHLKSSIDSQLSRGVDKLSSYLSSFIEHLFFTCFLAQSSWF